MDAQDQRTVIEFDPTSVASVARAATVAKAIQAHHTGGRVPRFYFAPECATDSHWEFASFAAKLAMAGAVLTVAAVTGGLWAGVLRGIGRGAEWAGDVLDAAAEVHHQEWDQDQGWADPVDQPPCLPPTGLALGALRCHAFASRCRTLAGVAGH
jgi:hypothetical protein